jgi:hypothetical protein
VKLTTHLILVLRLKIQGATSIFQQPYTSWGYVSSSNIKIFWNIPENTSRLQQATS